MKMRFITPTSLNSVTNSIQNDHKLCEITDAEICAFAHSCDLASMPRSVLLVPKCRVQYYLSSYQVRLKSVRKTSECMPTFFVLFCFVLFVCLFFVWTQSVSNLFVQLKLLHYHINFSSWSNAKCAIKWSKYVLHCVDLVTPRAMSRLVTVVQNGRSQWYR